MRNQKLTDKYIQVVESVIAAKKTVKESPQTAPAPVKPGTKPTTTPGTPTKPVKPNDPFFPKPGQSPRPKAKVISEEENCEVCGLSMNLCKCGNKKRGLEKEASGAVENPALKRFVAKRTRYTQ